MSEPMTPEERAAEAWQACNCEREYVGPAGICLEAVADAIRAAESAAYRRGAEAMRERLRNWLTEERGRLSGESIRRTPLAGPSLARLEQAVTEWVPEPEGESQSVEEKAERKRIADDLDAEVERLRDLPREGVSETEWKFRTTAMHVLHDVAKCIRVNRSYSEFRKQIAALPPEPEGGGKTKEQAHG